MLAEHHDRMTVDPTSKPYETERVDLGWQPEPLWDEWPHTYDSDFAMHRMEQAFSRIATSGWRAYNSIEIYHNFLRRKVFS